MVIEPAARPVAELLLCAVSTDGVRQAVGRLIDGLEPVDGFARDVCGDLTKTVEWLVSRVKAVRAENWELSRALIRLESRIDQLEADRVEQQAAVNHGPGAGIP